MGGSFSRVQQVVQVCTFQKQEFNEKIEVISDVHSVLQHYAKILLEERMPSTLARYANFGAVSEEYFNSRRKEKMQAILDVNPKLANYYDLYKALDNLQQEYEKPEMNEKERRAKITNVFLILQVALQTLVEELRESCDMQGRPANEEE